MRKEEEEVVEEDEEDEELDLIPLCFALRVVKFGILVPSYLL